jgi:6-phosphogluconate dehydrogenase
VILVVKKALTIVLLLCQVKAQLLWQSIKQGAHSIQELVLKLRKARQFVHLVKADTAVNDFIK